MQTFIREISGRGIRPGLERMRAGLETLGNPHLNMEIVLVAGTNGKGTVAKLVETMARSRGARTFLFTSPHLVCLEERYRFDGVQIETQELQACHRACLERLPRGETAHGFLTPFEWMTLVGFVAASQRNRDLWVLEVGLGGRLDSTNCVEPSVSVVTGIGLDHMDRLGPDHASIAAEKAGVFRNGVPAIIGSSAAPWIQFSGARVEGVDFLVSSSDGAAFYRTGGDEVELRGYEALPPSARSNFAVACAAYEAWSKASGKELSEALEAATLSEWPGRCQSISDLPLVLVDGAHNPDGASWLAAELCARFPETRFHLLFGAKEGKDARGILDALSPVVERVTLVSDVEGMLLSAEDLEKSLGANSGSFGVAEDSLGALLETASGPTLVAGSLFLVGEAIRAMGVQDSLVRLN